MKQLLKKQGFTLVELIIVIAIIAVLAVAAFMMLTKWLGKSRDSRRLSDLGTIARGLQVGYSDVDDGINMYPTVENQTGAIALLSGTVEIGYQGIVDNEVVKGAQMQKAPLDPSDKNEYTYLVTQNRQKFQLLGLLEDGTEVQTYLNTTYALDYSNRVPVTRGFDLGVLLETGTNLPIQYAGESFTGIDLTSGIERENYKAIVSTNYEKPASELAELPIMNENFVSVVEDENVTIEGDDTVGRKWSDGTYSPNCNSYKELGCSNDGVYWIDLDGEISPFKVYCDMTTDDGGWIVIGHDQESRTSDDMATDSTYKVYDITYNLPESQIISILSYSGTSDVKQTFNKKCYNALITKEYGPQANALTKLGDSVAIQLSTDDFDGNATICDSNDNVRRETNYTFTNTLHSDLIPIKSLWGGDSDLEGEYSSYSIGKLYIR